MSYNVCVFLTSKGLSCQINMRNMNNAGWRSHLALQMCPLIASLLLNDFRCDYASSTLGGPSSVCCDAGKRCYMMGMPSSSYLNNAL